MRRLALLAPEFPPCGLAGVHRQRALAIHLRSCGYEPLVFTVAREAYETRPDPELERSLPPDLEIVRLPTLPVSPVRFVGDLSLRSMPAAYRRLDRVVRERAVDLVYVSGPPWYLAVLGAWLRARYAMPFVLDLQDPWRQPVLPAHRRSLKALGSHLLAASLEPYVVARADGIVTISAEQHAALAGRYPRLQGIPWVSTPVGFETADLPHIDVKPSPWLAPLAGRKVFLHAGVATPRAFPTYRAVIRAAKVAASRDPALHLLFVGTGNDWIAEAAASEGASALVTNVAERLSYFDVLRLLKRVHAAMILGLMEPHYAPSKLGQTLACGRPLLAALHERCEANVHLQGDAAIALVTADSDDEIKARGEALAEAFMRLVALPTNARREAPLDPELTSAAAVRRIAAMLDELLGGAAGPR